MCYGFPHDIKLFVKFLSLNFLHTNELLKLRLVFLKLPPSGLWMKGAPLRPLQTSKKFAKISLNFIKNQQIIVFFSQNHCFCAFDTRGTCSSSDRSMLPTAQHFSSSTT